MNTLLSDVTTAVHQAGQALFAQYSQSSRPKDKGEMHRMGTHLGELATDILQPALSVIRPEARWVEEDRETSALAPGERWAVDPIEGGSTTSMARTNGR